MGNKPSIDLTNSEVLEVLDVNIYIDEYINENKNTENYAKMVKKANNLNNQSKEKEREKNEKIILKSLIRKEIINSLNCFYELNDSILLIHNVPVRFTWVGATKNWDGEKNISYLTIQLNINKKEFENKIQNQSIRILVPNENEINMIKFYYEDNEDTSNTSKKIYIITITNTKTCNFDLVCKNCKPQNQSMGNVLYYTNDEFTILKSSCENRYGGEGVLKFLKKKYIKKPSK